MTMGKGRKQSQPHLPFDLVVEILSRLPVKHLLQLRCISKSWNSLISGDSNFADNHLRLSTSDHNRHHLILTPTRSSSDFLLIRSPISPLFTSTFTTTTLKHLTYSSIDILIHGYYGNRPSTCNGLVCFNLYESSALLCNPSIGKFKVLPPLMFPHKTYFVIEYTLVYDRFTNNYKIIAININLRSRKKEVSIYTLGGTDYWRRIQDFPGPHLILMSRFGGTFVNDSVNWLTCDSKSDSAAHFIVSLCLENESYRKLSLPDVNSSLKSLGTLRGCLSLLSRLLSGDKFSDVWIMKEYGNESSWTKLLTVPPMVECRSFYHYTRALYISEDDKVLMECSKKEKNSLVVYDSRNNTFNTPEFRNNIHGEMVAQEVYVESLISPL